MKQTYFLKAAEIRVLSPALASSFEKNPKPLKEAVCPDLVGLSGGGEDTLPILLHIGPPLPGPLLSEPEVASSFLSVSVLIRLGLVSYSIHLPPDALSMALPSAA